MAESLDVLIMRYLRSGGPASFAQLCRDLPGAAGDLVFSLRPGLVIWAGASQAFIDALRRLERDGQVKYRRVARVVYRVDGADLRLPLARGVREYRTDHWLPLEVAAVENGEQVREP